MKRQTNLASDPDEVERAAREAGDAAYEREINARSAPGLRDDLRTGALTSEENAQAAFDASRTSNKLDDLNPFAGLGEDETVSKGVTIHAGESTRSTR